LLTIRKRPVGNTLVIAGVVSAAIGSAVAGLGVAQTAVFIVLGVVLLYLGFTSQGKNFVSFRLGEKHPG
jgi:Flp pilus assembly protein protease CpaA